MIIIKHYFCISHLIKDMQKHIFIFAVEASTTGGGRHYRIRELSKPAMAASIGPLATTSPFRLELEGRNGRRAGAGGRPPRRQQRCTARPAGWHAAASGWPSRGQIHPGLAQAGKTRGLEQPHTTAGRQLGISLTHVSWRGGQGRRRRGCKQSAAVGMDTGEDTMHTGEDETLLIIN